MNRCGECFQYYSNACNFSSALLLSLRLAGVQEAHITMSMSMWPTNQYRRQALRTNLDVIVSIGGILGLFLGASLLSAIEFIYYFTIRAINNRRAGSN